MSEKIKQEGDFKIKKKPKKLINKENIHSNEAPIEQNLKLSKVNKANVVVVKNISLKEALKDIKSLLAIGGSNIASMAEAYYLVKGFSEQEIIQALDQLKATANETTNMTLLSLLLS